MSVKLNSEKYLFSEDYVYMLILINRECPNELHTIQDIIFSVIKCFLSLFKTEKIKSFLSSLIIHGEFRENGILTYWLKNKCKVLYINTLHESKIDTLIRRAEEGEIPLYKNIDPNTKILKNVCMGPYWTNKLAKLSNEVEQEFLKIVK